MEHDGLMVAFIGNTLRVKVSVENFDKLITHCQNSSDFSIIKVLCYTVTFHFQFFGDLLFSLFTLELSHNVTIHVHKDHAT